MQPLAADVRINRALSTVAHAARPSHLFQTVNTMDNNDFFAPEFVDRDFTRNGKTRKFRIRELTGSEAETLFDLRGRDGKQDSNKLKGLDSRLISTSVVDVTDGGEGEAITVDQAGKLPAKFRKELTAAVIEINGLASDAPAAQAAD